MEQNCDRPPRELHGIHLIGYCVTSFGNIMPISLFNGFIYYYYIYVVGLDALLTSVGIAIGLVINALSNPIMGVLSDNIKPSKWGKRKIFLIIGAPFELLFSYFIWTPQFCPPGHTFFWPTALYMWIMSVGFNFTYVVVGCPYGAMLPEQSETEKNRIGISAIQGIFNILGTVIGVVLPILIESTLPDAQKAFWNTASGAKLTSLVPIIGFIFGIVLIFSVIFTYFTVDESFFLKECEVSPKKRTVGQVFNQLLQPFKHDNTRQYYWSSFAANFAMRILMTILMPLVTYVLLLQGAQFIIFIGILIPVTFLGFVLWNSVVHKWGLQRSYGRSNIVIAIICFIALVFLIKMPQNTLMIVGIIIMGVALAALVGQFLFTNPIMSALVDEGQQYASIFKFKDTENLAGAYFGMWSLIINLASGVANLILGLIYTGTNATNPFLLVMSLPITGVFYILTVLFLNRVKSQPKLSASTNGEESKQPPAENTQQI